VIPGTGSKLELAAGEQPAVDFVIDLGIALVERLGIG